MYFICHERVLPIEKLKVDDYETCHYALNTVCYVALYQTTFGFARGSGSLPSGLVTEGLLSIY